MENLLMSVLSVLSVLSVMLLMSVLLETLVMLAPLQNSFLFSVEIFMQKTGLISFYLIT